jgi:hypothetical protein
MRLVGQRETHVDLGAHVVLVVFDLGLGERGAARDAPVHGLLGLVDEVLLDEAGQLAHDGGLVFGGHREIRLVPLAEDAEALELLLLDGDVFVRIFAALAAERNRGHLALLGAQIPVDLELDRQAVAVPAGHVRRVLAHHAAAAEQQVLEDLVHDVADVDVAVRVGRSVVQDEERRVRPRGA